MFFVGPFHILLGAFSERQSLAKFFDVAIAELRVQQNIIMGFRDECFVITSGSLQILVNIKDTACLKIKGRREIPYFESQILSNTKSLAFDWYP